MKICFVDTTKLNYSYQDIKSEKIRGGESSLINLSKKLSEMGHNVTIFNNTDKEFFNKKYNWLNLNRVDLKK